MSLNYTTEQEIEVKAIFPDLGTNEDLDDFIALASAMGVHRVDCLMLQKLSGHFVRVHSDTVWAHAKMTMHEEDMNFLIRSLARGSCGLPRIILI